MSKHDNKPADGQEPYPYDLLIVGGGYVGLSVAVATQQAAPDLSIGVIDASPKKALEKDNRASAIAYAATRMLEQMSIWPEVEHDAQPIHEMIVTDSRLNDIVRPVFLTFDTPEDGLPFAHMLPNKTLISALRNKAEQLGIDCHYDCKIDHMELTQDQATIIGTRTLASQRTAHQVFCAKLLVAADGVHSKLRSLANIKTAHWSYDQLAIVTTVAHEREHHGQAVEHFMPAGPFAILPLKGNFSSLVWTESSNHGQKIMGMDGFDFALELEKRFGHKLGKLEEVGPRKSFPLGLTLAREFVKPRFALAGDAAHGIHPIAGQGLNLGFKDAAALSQNIVQSARMGLDIGDLHQLEEYQAWRRFDTVKMGATTDVLNRLFATDNWMVRHLRDLGMGMVDRLPGLKKQLIGQAAGTSGSIPNLLQGLAI